MPALTPVTEVAETLGVLTEGSENLSAVSEGAETITPLSELVDESTTHIGFFPGSVLQTEPYPFPSSTSYPGDTVVVGTQGLSLAAVAEGSETLTPLAEI